MSWDDATDEVIEYLRTVLGSAPNLALASTLGHDFPAVRVAKGYPLSLGSLQTSELPALHVYVESQRSVARGRGTREDEALTVVIEYMGPQTALAKLGTRWPLLRAVWRAIATALRTGEVDGADWASPIGLNWHTPGDDVVTFDHATDGELAYPHFIARTQIEVRIPDDGFDALEAFSVLGVDINLVPTAGIEPIVEVEAP